MKPGDVVASRFRVQRAVGHGGMGGVFLAEDLRDGRAVALKVLAFDDASAAARFEREARTLAAVHHPAVVGYVDHGASEQGEAYLAMEWLDGADLKAHLDAHGPLGPAAAVAVARRVAAGLAALHAAGIVHRDIKPANVVLEHNEPTRARIVDLGIARSARNTAALTRTGAVLGTVGYMAPEQIDGQRDLDARADVFALGCVLYECLAGRRAFDGDHAMAVLVRTLLEDAPRLREAAPFVPAELDEFVARCTSRTRELRPADGAALLRALDALPVWPTPGAAETPALDAPAPQPMLRGERRPIGVVLACARYLSGAAATVDFAAHDAKHAQVDAVAARWHGRAVRVGAAGFAIVVDPEGLDARAQAARAASAALELAAALPSWAVAVATPSADTSASNELPAALERAAERLEHAPGDDTGRVAVRTDRLSAALLGAGFEVEHDAHGAVLRGYVPTRDDARPLLGRSMPCVGRDKEIALLAGTLAECEDEGVARAVLLVGGGGFGKSKLRREFLERVGERGGVRVLRARAHAGSRWSALALLQELVLDAVGGQGAAGSAPWEAQRSLWLARLGDAGRAEGSQSAAQTVEFLAELAGLPPAVPCAALAAARADPAEMRWRTAAALRELLLAESRAAPLVVALEDLHDADPSSVGLLVDVWPALANRPVLLLGTARPEAESAHPALFALRGAQVVGIGPLGRRASERIVRQVLGDRADDASVASLVERAGGSPFLLEEIVRHVASGHAIDEAPDTVLALLQSRLLALDVEARRGVRAASVFGEHFPAAGVAALLDAGTRRDTRGSTDALLEHLTREEVLAPPRPDAPRGERSFRHGYIRDAAYAMLPADERPFVHGAVARWLAARDAPDAHAVAAHHAQAGDVVEAAAWFLRAARAAGERGALTEAAELARRGQTPGVDCAVRVELLIEEITARWIAGRFDEALDALAARAPWSELARGSDAWVLLKCTEVGLAGFSRRRDVFQEGVAALLALDRAPPLSCAWGRATVLGASALLYAGAVAPARRLIELAESSAAAPDDPERGHIEWTRALLNTYFDDPRAWTLVRSCLARLRGAGHRDRFGYEAVGALTLLEFGLFDEAAALARSARAAARQRNEAWYHDFAVVAEIGALALRAEPAPCRHLLRELGPGVDPLVAARAQVWAWLGAARVAPTDRAALEAAAAGLEALVEPLRPVVSVSGPLFAALAEVEWLRGRPEQALAWTTRGLEGLPALMMAPRTALQWFAARALAALGRDDDAARALAAARTRVHGIAAGIGDAAVTAAFLAHPAVAGLVADDRDAGNVKG